MNLYCVDAAPSLLGVFDTSIAPTLLFYAYLPILLISLFISVYLVIKDKASLRAILLASIALSLAGWIASALIQWIAAEATTVMYSWELIALFEISTFLLTVYFSEVFIGEKDISFNKKLALSAIALPVIILLPTKFNVSYFDINSCEGVSGPLWQYIYAIELISIAWIVISLFRKIRKETNATRKRLIFSYLIGVVIFLGTFFATNFFGEVLSTYEVNLFGPLGMAAFIATMAFLIVRYRAFNFKILGAQALVAALIILVGSILFIRHIENVRIVTLGTLVLLGFLGTLLTKSVKREVEQRERLQDLTTELEVNNEKLKILDKQKDEFLSFASHDLKSPIALIKQFATLVYDGTYKDPAKIHETVLKIKNTADRSVNMVNTFLDLRKIEEGRMEYNFEKKNIVEFISGITSDFTLLAKQQKNIDVSFSSTTPDMQVNMDTNTLRQVIQNFLDNSMKYTEAGWIKVEVVAEQKTVLIKVSDSGLGMDKELLPILFGQFHRDPGVAKKIQGTGLGLYIAKQIVLAHHGDTWAESEGKGKGSQFYIRLPKA